MSSWDDESGPRNARKPPHWSREAKKPPPEHGIKVKKVGTTWWGQRWIAALEQVLGGDSGRLLRGKTYARAGRTHDLVVHAGKVSAKVTGTRPAPYDVRIELTQLSDEAWRGAIQGMAEKAQFAAELLGDRMPTAIDEAFRGAGASLFPATRAELVTSCSCPDWGDPCKHVAATHYVLGEAFDRDPFLLFELRGRSKEQVLAGLRVARSDGDLVALAVPAGVPATAGTEALGGLRVLPRVALGAIDAADYDRAPTALPALEFSFEAPTQHGALLRQLGTPPAWRGEASPEELLAPLVHAAAEAARRIALGDAPTERTEAPIPAAPVTPRVARKRRADATARPPAASAERPREKRRAPAKPRRKA
jgi:uncharacterized Zn finger protein